MHPHFPLVFTSGIERHVILHSPVSSPPCAQELEASPSDVRSLAVGSLEDEIHFLREIIGSVDPELGDPGEIEDLRGIAYFDQ